MKSDMCPIGYWLVHCIHTRKQRRRQKGLLRRPDAEKPRRQAHFMYAYNQHAPCIQYSIIWGVLCVAPRIYSAIARHIETGTGGTWSPHWRHLEDLTQAEMANIWATSYCTNSNGRTLSVCGKRQEREASDGPSLKNIIVQLPIQAKNASYWLAYDDSIYITWAPSLYMVRQTRTVRRRWSPNGRLWWSERIYLRSVVPNNIMTVHGQSQLRKRLLGKEKRTEPRSR